jgi:hypothetical protein
MNDCGTERRVPAVDNPQVLLFTVGEERVRTVDQFVGDPTAVAAF